MDLMQMIASAPVDPAPVDFENDAWEEIHAAAPAVAVWCNAVATWCNEMAFPAPVLSEDVVRYLTLSDSMDAIREAARPGDATEKAATARKFIGGIESFESFDLQNPSYLARIAAELLALESHGLITQDDRAAILMLGDNRRSRAQAAGLPPVRASDVYRVMTAARVARENAARDEATRLPAGE